MSSDTLPSSDYLMPLAVLFILCIAVLSIVWHFKRSRQLLEKWAMEHGYEILHHEYRMLRKGPFFWTSSRGQAVYHVTVRDALGYERSGWVRCGSWWLGIWSDKVEVAWEE